MESFIDACAAKEPRAPSGSPGFACECLHRGFIRRAVINNSRFRDELLNRELFTGLEDARWVVDRWRLDYNHHRPHSSLGYQTPAEFAARCLAVAEKSAEA